MKGHVFLFLCLLLPLVLSTSLYIKHLEFGSNVPLFIQQRMQFWMKQKSSVTGDIILSIYLGNTSIVNQWITAQELQSQKAEGFIIKSNSTSEKSVIVAMNGNWNEEASYPIGVVYGCYTVLENYLGIYFSSHPLHISLQNEPHFLLQVLTQKETLVIKESPYWRIRGLHFHTLHPLELTELLNGFVSPDFHCSSCKTEDETFYAQVQQDWLPVCEWLVANRQNRLEYTLLHAKKFEQFSESTQRQNRLQLIAQTAQQFGLKVGMDVAVFVKQQHHFSLVRSDDPTPIMDQLRNRLAYVMKGMDYFSTELGFTEFTHGDVNLMLATLNESTRFCAEELGNKKSYVKIHVSQGQYIENFNDPQTGKPPMNFNFLPHYADKRMGLMPHTVQIPSLDDPVYTYGDLNFTFIGEFMFFEAKLNQREVIWYPENAYWIGYDINVPLFLPVYIYRRLYDLDKIIQRELRDNIKIDGQVIFHSGFEFGYWLNDVIVMRSAWNPYPNLSLEDRIAKYLQEVVLSFSQQTKEANYVSATLQALMKEQFETLVYGNQYPNKQVEKKHGIAYLQGIDTWFEMSLLVDELTGRKIETNPRCISLTEVSLLGQSSDKQVSYINDIKPVLQRMDQSFSAFADQLETMSIFYPNSDSFSDIFLSTKLLSLRAHFQFNLYEYAYGFFSKQPLNWKIQQRQLLVTILNTTATIMKAKIEQFRFSVDRIASWRDNPTSYPFTYLWQAKTLFFWWRSFVKFDKGIVSPCFMNTIDAVDVTSGEGFYDDLAKIIKHFLDEHKWIPSISECLSAPSTEPIVPPFP